MANILPGAVWQPVDVAGRAKRRKGRGLVGHVAVSSSKNLIPGPLSSRNADWHFYLPKTGPAIQYIDMDLQCWATSAGNASLVAFESEGGMGSSAQLNAEPWTGNQLDWAARILRHLHDTEGVPLQVMPDSLPGSRGFGTHRLGISPWRVAGGEVWSSANGKECPGNTKHGQRAEVVRRAAAEATAPSPSLLESDMADLELCRTPEGTIWKVTALEVASEGNSNRANALAATRGQVGYINVSMDNIRDAQADADARRARLLADIAKAAGGHVDEALIVAGLLPAITTALAGKVGGASKEEIAELLKGITLKAS